MNNLTHVNPSRNVARLTISLHKYIGFGFSTEVATGPVVVLGYLTIQIVRKLTPELNEKITSHGGAARDC